MPIPRDDEARFALCRSELYTAVVGDVMDQLGLRRQFLPPQVRPLRPEMVVCGRAMPVLEADVFGDRVAGTANPLSDKPFGWMLEALDDLRRGEIYLCTGASPRYALWGELMTARAQHCGAVGAIVNGYVRDTRGILALDFPTFCWGSYAQDQGPRGKVIDWRVPLELDGTRVEPGDLLFGDIDGVCVVPRAAEDEVLAGALDKVRGENIVREAILGGLPAAEAFARYGIM